MLTLHFRNAVLGHTHTVGPLPAFRISGNALSADGVEAVHRNGVWEVGGRSFPVVATEAPTAVYFEDAAGRVSGRLSLDRVAFFDGVLRAGAEFLDLLARLDEPSGVWHLYADGTAFPTAVFMAV